MAGRATITQVTATAFTIPTDAPESDGTLAWDATTIVVVEAAAGGCTGIGHSYADASASARDRRRRTVHRREWRLHCARRVEAGGAFAESGVTWFEEPVASADSEGLAFIRTRAPAGMEIAAGEYGYDLDDFRRLLDARAVDVLQADVTRCGGYTGILQVDALCAAHNVQLSTHTAPLLHAPFACPARAVRHVEHFHDHVRIERVLFDGVPEPENGMLQPDRSRAGIGVEFRRVDAARFLSSS